MSLTPRYDGSPVMQIAGSPGDQLAPMSRQRRRLEKVLVDLPPDAWRAASRCPGWSVKDVVAHLNGVNSFWTLSVRAGLDERPTQFLRNFDPVATPERLVADTRDLSTAAVLEQFTASNKELLDVLEALDDDGWAALAEAPPGHLPVRLVASHALWDSWTHERDIVLPLGLDQPLHDDEVAASLRYVCALSASIALLSGQRLDGTYGVAARFPETRFSLDVEESVTVRDDPPPASSPILTGNAVTLTEALSTRVAFPSSPPDAWLPLIDGLVSVFTLRS